MTQSVRDDIRVLLDKKDISIQGIADADLLNRTAPEGFRPEEMLPGARSVLIAARPLPLSVFQTPPNNGLYSFYAASFHTYYQAMNDAMNTVCLALEDAGYPSLPIPAYSPLKFHKGELRGLVSLKHAAVAAGLASFSLALADGQKPVSDRDDGSVHLEFLRELWDFLLRLSDRLPPFSGQPEDRWPYFRRSTPRVLTRE